MSHTCFKITHCTHMIAEVLACDSFSTDHLAKSSIIFCYVWGKKRISILFWRGYMGIVVIVQSKKDCHSYWKELWLRKPYISNPVGKLVLMWGLDHTVVVNKENNQAMWFHLIQQIFEIKIYLCPQGMWDFVWETKQQLVNQTCWAQLREKE